VGKSGEGNRTTVDRTEGNNYGKKGGSSYPKGSRAQEAESKTGEAGRGVRSTEASSYFHVGARRVRRSARVTDLGRLPREDTQPSSYSKEEGTTQKRPRFAPSVKGDVGTK